MNNNSLEDLTIVIPTYNRREQLIRQLNSIYSQPESDQVSILIIDNHSNYNVEETIKCTLGPERTSNLTVHVNSRNFGMHTNLALPFFYCKTDWMWTLSDDDETLCGSINTVLDNIKRRPDVAVFKYQIQGFDQYDSIDLNCLEDLIGFYCSSKCHSGHLAFLSNAVYNLNLIRNYDSDILSHCYCAIPQVLPIFNILSQKAGCVRFESTPLVKFIPPGKNKGWNYLNTAIQFSIVPFFNYDISFKDYKRLGHVIMSNFSHVRIIISALELENKKRGRFLYEQIYSRSFRFSGRIVDKIYRCLFYFLYYTGLRISYDTALHFREKVRRIYPRFR